MRRKSHNDRKVFPERAGSLIAGLTQRREAGFLIRRRNLHTGDDRSQRIVCDNYQRASPLLRRNGRNLKHDDEGEYCNCQRFLHFFLLINPGPTRAAN